MPSYAEAKIYSIASPQSTDVWYGMTMQSTQSRWRNHQTAYNAFLRGRGKYVPLYDILQYGDAAISTVAEIPSRTKTQALALFGAQTAGKGIQTAPPITLEEWRTKFPQHRRAPTKAPVSRKRRNETKRMRHTCECGANISKGAVGRHLQSAIHARDLYYVQLQDFLNS